MNHNKGYYCKYKGFKVICLSNKSKEHEDEQLCKSVADPGGPRGPGPPAPKLEHTFCTAWHLTSYNSL